MNKIILATFLALAVGATFAWESDCTLRIGAQGASCQASKECAEGLSCVKGLCTLVTFNSACSSDADCGGDYAWCLGGVCDMLRIPGDPCTQNVQCMSGTCDNGACLAKFENQNCTGGDCAKGLWCNPMQGVCQSRLGNNANCGDAYGMMMNNNQFAHDLSVMCDGANICNAQLSNGVWTGTCQGTFSIDNVGGSCNMDLGKYQCDLGYYCTGSNNSMTCQASNGNALCSDVWSCSGAAEYCLCQPTVNGAIPVTSGSDNGNGDNNDDNGVNVDGSGVNAGGDNGVDIDGSGVSVGGDNGVNIDGSGVNAGGNNGVDIDGSGVSVGGDNGVNAGDSGVNAGGDNGVNIDGSGVSVGGDNGASAGDNGVNAGGDNGVDIDGSGVSVGGDNGVNIDGSGVSIGGDNGINIGKTTQTQFGETYGFCQVDQCQSNFAQDYYNCLLENDCGLVSAPVLVSNSCASRCYNQYRALKCCQAGFNMDNDKIAASNNEGRWMVVDTQGLNCDNSIIQPPAQIEDSGASQVVASVAGLACLIALAF